MAESKVHQHLVDLTYKYICSIVPAGSKVAIEVDTPESLQTNTTICGFRPDVFYKYNSLTIIGEAKTANDFLSSHSQQQYQAYLETLTGEVLNGKSVLLVIAVPWNMAATAFNYFKALKKKINNEINITIITDSARKFNI